jgi:hypothetical protein
MGALHEILIRFIARADETMRQDTQRGTATSILRMVVGLTAMRSPVARVRVSVMGTDEP